MATHVQMGAVAISGIKMTMVVMELDRVQDPQVDRHAIITAVMGTMEVDITVGAKTNGCCKAPIFKIFNMKNNTIKILALIILLLTSNSILAQVKHLEKNKLVRLTVLFNNEVDKSKVSISQQYDRFALSNTNLQKDFKFLREENAVNTSEFFISLETPKIIFVNLKPLYVEPNNLISLKYRFMGLDDHKAPIETLELDATEGIFLVKNVNSYQANMAKARLSILNEVIKNKFAVNRTINILDSLANKHLDEIVKNNPNYDFTAQRNKFFKDYFVESYYNNIMVALGSYPEKLAQFAQLILTLNKRISLQNTLKENQYFFAQRNIYLNIYQRKWEKNDFDFEAISTELKDYDPLTRQFYFLLIIKNNLQNIRDGATLKKISDAITNTSFRGYADKYLIAKTTPDKGLYYLSKDIQNLRVFTTDLKDATFGDIFNNTKQDYLYLDFCGSWCAPCIKEIEEYGASSRKFDNSKKIRPIWLFFENNKLSWLKVVEKNKLKRENCYLILDSKLQQLFGEQFEWMGEFPHHFLFSKDGKIINSNAPSLIKLSENFLPIKSGAIEPPPFGP